MIINILTSLLILLSHQQSLVDWTFNGNFELKEEAHKRVLSLKAEKWAIDNLKTGDIIYCSGVQTLFGVFDFSGYIRNITNNRYSHCGMVVRMANQTWVIDCDQSGVRKPTFSWFLTESLGRQILVQRVKEEYRPNLFIAINNVWIQYIRNVPFDYNFRLGKDKLYCTELIVNAFAESRILMCQPVKIGNFPAIDKYTFSTFLILGGSYFYLKEPFSLEQKIYSAANLQKSKYLQTIFEGVIP